MFHDQQHRSTNKLNYSQAPNQQAATTGSAENCTRAVFPVRRIQATFIECSIITANSGKERKSKDGILGLVFITPKKIAIVTRALGGRSTPAGPFPTNVLQGVALPRSGRACRLNSPSDSDATSRHHPSTHIDIWSSEVYEETSGLARRSERHEQRKYSSSLNNFGPSIRKRIEAICATVTR
ncbi:hypothetical protein CGGC5_v004573 [Colletotrichum fructicola Nara gc5]|uniref:Uncharacterized protein n=1 Tax=Colletotrichum fructicola (strain Nara gc5) TaxID=1213859 RepID=A0A7J6JF50_COLFN|nr:hypothetical protein CGGC5_v004573 [Colletotrichum fructicola Nara gc5]